MSKRTASTAGAVAALAVLLLVGFIVSVKTTDGANGTPNPPVQCIGTHHFYANDARPGSNQFGPELKDGSVEAGNARYDLKLRSDAAFAAVEEDLILFNLEKVKAHGDGWYQLRAQQFLNDEALWCKTVKQIHGAIKRSWVEDRQEKYHTFLMVARGDQIPLVRRTDRPVPMGHVLGFELKDGRIEFHRFICDLQPARENLPGVPSIKVPATPKAPATPSTPRTPHVCPPEMPHGTWPICKDDPSNDPSQQGNVPTGVTGQAPPVNGPASPPAAGTPPPVYNPPEQPTATTVPRGGGGGPTTTIPPNEGGGGEVPPDGGGGPACDPQVCG